MENDKLDEDFEHDLCQVLTKYYGDNWSNFNKRRYSDCRR